MADEPRLSPPRDANSSDEETVRGGAHADADADTHDDAHPLVAEAHEDGAPEDADDHDNDTTSDAPLGNGLLARRYRAVVAAAAARGDDDAAADALGNGRQHEPHQHHPQHPPPRTVSPIDSLASTPDDSPSVQGSALSSPSSSVLPSRAARPGLRSPTPSFRPFDRRFQSRIASPSSSLSPRRPSSPAFLPGQHSRTASLASSHHLVLDPRETESASPPWEAVRWTRLRKLDEQAFSEAGRRTFGSPTCMAVSATIVLGTSKGVVLVFDYHQNLKLILGPGTQAVESGPVVSVAVSADHTTIGAGHASGSIFTWDTTRPSRPFLSIPPLDPSRRPPPDHPPHRHAAADGHLPHVAVTHLGFLGTRHTALVSADDRGMAFSHLATRGTGALGRTVKTTRILGRYPPPEPPPPPAPPASSSVSSSPARPRKPSTVLALAPLPLGNVERATDALGLTALLTPYLLVVVSTTPVAQTQHKAARPREVALSGTTTPLTGCLAWFPAVRLRVPDPATGRRVAPAKLAYCWSDVLTVLDVDEAPAADGDRDAPPQLRFRARSRWRGDEAVVAVQWLSRSVLALLTLTQRLLVVEDRSMRVTEAFDLLPKYIYHADLFSRPLRPPVDDAVDGDTSGRDGDASSLQAPVADAFYMSFKAYKGRLFLLGFDDVSVGALANWADRLLALMEHGDAVAAIRLAAAYYAGDADQPTVGLPEDAALRHAVVRDKVVDIMRASLRYAFAQRRQRRRKKDRRVADDEDGDDLAHLRALAEACFVACRTIDDDAFLFDEVYAWYDGDGDGDGDDEEGHDRDHADDDSDDDAARVRGLFLDTLEPYVLDGAVTAVPPAVVQALVAHFVDAGRESRLEDLICRLDPAALDLDRLTALCRRHGLYDALLYVWNQALRDFVTPLVDLLRLLAPPPPPTRDGEPVGSGGGAAADEADEAAAAADEVHALKIFPYLSYVLTGRVYPRGDPMPDEVAARAKAQLYWFLFSGRRIAHAPAGRGTDGRRDEPSFPYLRAILRFDAPSFLSALNEAFEDAFLNDDSAEKQLLRRLLDGSAAEKDAVVGDEEEEQLVFGRTVDRQYIVTILTEILHPPDFGPEDTVYLDMFLARNLPKYPQYLLLPGSALTAVLVGLCRYPGRDLADDAQLSAEYLLSAYRPPDMAALLPLFRAAGFYRILKRTYRADGRYGPLVETYFEDPEDRAAVFDCVDECLRPRRGLTRRQVQDVHRVLREHARQLVELDPARAAALIAAHAPELHQAMLDAVAADADHDHDEHNDHDHDHDADHDHHDHGPDEHDDHAAELQYAYLRALLEGDDRTQERARAAPGRDHLVEQYVRLLCRFDPAHVSDYVGAVQAADLRLETLLPTMEATGVVDAAVVLLAREGLVREAMDRLVRHLETLESAFQGLLAGATRAAAAAAAAGTTTTEAAAAGTTAAAATAAATAATAATDVDLQSAAEELVAALQKYTRVGIWLCQEQTKAARQSSPGVRQRERQNPGQALTWDESLWLRLVDTAVQITRRLSACLESWRREHASPQDGSSGGDGSGGGGDVATTGPATAESAAIDVEKLLHLLRALVQNTFTALLTSTSTSTSTSSARASPPSPPAPGSNLAFLRILRAFLSRAAASSPSLADLRAVLASIFAAYAYEESILQLSNRLLERSLFVSVRQAVALRQRGWRSRGSTCEACGRRVWGPGVSGNVFAAWEAKKEADERRRRERRKAAAAAAALLHSTGPLSLSEGKGKASQGVREEEDYGGKGKGKDKGKGKGKEPVAADEEVAAGAEVEGRRGGQGDGREGEPALSPLVVLACRHIYHQSCLEALQSGEGDEDEPGDGTGKRYRCPIDG